MAARRRRTEQADEAARRRAGDRLAGARGRILAFSVAVAHVWAEQPLALDEAGLRMPLADSYNVATARRHGLTIVTGNDRDSRRPGVKVFNPFEELAYGDARRGPASGELGCSLTLAGVLAYSVLNRRQSDLPKLPRGHPCPPGRGPEGRAL